MFARAVGGPTGAADGDPDAAAVPRDPLKPLDLLRALSGEALQPGVRVASGGTPRLQEEAGGQC